MAVFPVTKKPSSFSETPTKGQIKSEFENGDVLSRPRYSRMRRIFTIGWENLPSAQYLELIDFFDENQGYTFTFEHPITEVLYTVRFSDDDIGSWSQSVPGYYAGSINIEEA